MVRYKYKKNAKERVNLMSVQYSCFNILINWSEERDKKIKPKQIG